MKGVVEVVSLLVCVVTYHDSLTVNVPVVMTLVEVSVGSVCNLNTESTEFDVTCHLTVEIAFHGALTA